MPSTPSLVEPALTGSATAKPKPAFNDLSIRVGTVNGSGSQSANLVILRALHAMGIPCGGKNVFPSNIEGLPTWFHLRANVDGHLAHRADPDVLVCMNELTAHGDLLELKPGAICVYRDDFSADLSTVRDDVTCFAVPFNALVAEAYPPDKTDKSYRDKLRKVINMVYVGVVASLCGIEIEAVDDGIRREFPGRKAKAGAINIAAARAGYDWAQANLPTNLPCRVKRLDATDGQILIDGNKAAALGAVFGGVSVVTWYPITPSSSVAEDTEDLLKRYRTDAEGNQTFAVIQAEDELAAIGMAIGAGWAGARSMTATSGPGISLMTEFVGMGYFAEIPVVIIDVQRMGPSTGLPTRTSQGDVMKLHLLGHGDCRNIVLIPGTVQECFELVIESLNAAQRYQTPVFVALDLDLGMNLWLTPRFSYPEKPIDRGKVLSAEDLERQGSFHRYKDVDGDGICQRTIPGTEHPLAAYFTRGTGHDESSGYSERPEVWKKNLDRLTRKLETARAELPAPIVEGDPDAPVGLIAYGGTNAAMAEAREQLADEGVNTAYCRIRALPLSDEVGKFIEQHQRVYVIEQNRDAQIMTLLRERLRGELIDRLVSITHYDGTPIAAENVSAPILEREQIAAGPEIVATNGKTHGDGDGAKTMAAGA